MEMNIDDAAKDPTIGVVTTNGEEPVDIEAPPQEPEGGIVIPFSQVENEEITEESEKVIEQTFAPSDEKARTRFSDMVVQLTASLRLRAMEAGGTIEEAYSERKDKIQESESLDDRAKQLSLAMLDQAYAAGARQGPVDPEDKETVGALNMLAHGLIKASDAGNIKAKLQAAKKKPDRKSKKTTKSRAKNKQAKLARRKQRKKK